MTDVCEAPQTLIDSREIQKLIPHRYPFLLVDKVVELDLEERRIKAIKNVTVNEPFFPGHFPGGPIMPGVLILEALAQAGAILFAKVDPSDKISVLLSVNNAKFRTAVHPGDTLELDVVGTHKSSSGGRAKARALVNGKLACQAEVCFARVSREQV